MLEVDSEQNLENSYFKGPSWYLIDWISSGFDGFLAFFFVSGVTPETSTPKKNVSISFSITSLLYVPAIFTGLLRLIPIHFLNVLIFLGRADEDCMFNSVLFFYKRWHIIPYEPDEHQQLHQMIHLSCISISESFFILLFTTVTTHEN